MNSITVLKLLLPLGIQVEELLVKMITETGDPNESYLSSNLAF